MRHLVTPRAAPRPVNPYDFFVTQDRTRYEVQALEQSILVLIEQKERTARDLADLLNVPRRTMSYALNSLTRQGKITSREIATRRVAYRRHET